jgi:nitrogen fixation/metabolism regulation signal transduction histidine kinase
VTLGRRRVGAKPGPGRIQTRIALSMLLSAALLAPVVVVSLFYLGRMSGALNRVIETDVELMRLGDRITLTFLDARRSEKNYLLYSDSCYLAAARASADEVVTLCDQGRALERELKPVFDSLLADVAVYRLQLDTIVALLGGEAGAGYTQALARLRAEHQRLLEAAAATEDSLARDSALTAADLLAARADLPVAGLLGRILNEQVRATEARVVDGARTVSDYAAGRTRDSQRQARQFSTWGQRNVATALLLVAVALIWAVTALPRNIVLPLKRIANALGRAERGELDVRVTVHGRDELDQLARQLNRVFSRLRESDSRKTSHIQQLERRFRLLAADIAEGVLVFDRTPNLLYANAAVESLLGRPAADARGYPLSDFPGLSFLREAVEDTLSDASGHQECDVLPGLPSSAVCIEALRDSAGAIVGALVVITNPAPPGVGADEAADATT